MSRYATPIIVAALVVVALLGAAIVGAACDDASSADDARVSASPDPVVLRVDDRPVRQSAVDAVRAEFRLGGSEDSEARAEREAVRRELVRREAERLDLTADAAEVSARRQAMVDQLGGEQALAAALEQVPMTEEQLLSGITDGVLREAVQDAKFGDLTVSRNAARSYYERHRDRFREAASAHLWSIQVAAERIAETALGRLRSGQPFEQVARQFSTDAQSRDAGGDLGTVALESLPAPLRRAVERAPAGQVTKPVQGPGGWYLLKATDLKQARVVPFREAEARIVEELARHKRFVALDEWLDGQRKAATVERL
ncbi:MAG: hypothetical protein GX624_03890 [Actinobacteria bacterium]|nr:hypothetical protein [Actinomycetota bacterium]